MHRVHRAHSHQRWREANDKAKRGHPFVYALRVELWHRKSSKGERTEVQIPQQILTLYK